MEIKEYEYLVLRPDTFPLATLEAIRNFLITANRSDHIDLIDRVISTGLMQPPSNWNLRSYYKAAWSDAEKRHLIDDLTHAQKLTSWSDAEAKLLGQCTRGLIRCLEVKPLSHDEYHANYPSLDLTNISLADFQKLHFETILHADLQEEERIFTSIRTTIHGDHEYIARLYMDMFSQSEELLGRYSEEALERGFWMAMGSSLRGFTAHDLVWGEGLAIETKERLIESMYDLYMRFFMKTPLIHACEMWWDSFAFCFFRVNPAASENNRRIQDAMFKTLQKVLALESRHCQGAALHGLGHLRHRDTAGVINAYIDLRRAQLSEWDIRYANGCIAGDIM